MSTNCPNCGTEYERIGNHFARGSCDFPPLSGFQRAYCTFLILRGATVRRDGQNPRLEVASQSEQNVREVADSLEWVTNEPRVLESAGDAYERMQERDPSMNFERENFNDYWGVSTISHPAFASRESPAEITTVTDEQGCVPAEPVGDGPARVTGVGSVPADVDFICPETLRWVLEARGSWVGLLFGSLHIDLRGWDVSGEQFRKILANHGVPTAEYDGDGYAEDDFTRRYHWSDDVVVVPHYAGMDVLEYVGLSVNDVAEPIKLRGA